MTRRRATFEPAARPTGCRHALTAGVLGCLGAIAFVMTPVLIIVLAQPAALRGFSVPVDTITTPLLAGYALAAGLLALTAHSRSTTLAWILASTAVASAISVSLSPTLIQL